MKLQTNWDNISTEFEPLPDDVYVGTIEEIEETTDDNKGEVLIYKLRVISGETTGDKLKERVQRDYVYLKTKEGKKNEIGWGRVKAYHEAIHGELQKTGQEVELDTANQKGQNVAFVVKSNTYKDKKDGDKEKTSSKVTRVFKVS